MLWALAPGAATANGDTIDLFDTNEAKLAWDPAAGPVVGYYVIVSRDAAEPAVDSVVMDPQASILAEFGESIVVTVSAFDASGVPGPASAPSPIIRFNAATDGGGGDPPGDGGGDPPGDEEPPDDGGPPDDSGPPATVPATANDFTGDGVSDLVIREDGDVSIFAIEPGATPTEFGVPEIASQWQNAGHGDLDGNGSVDLVMQNPDGSIVGALLFAEGLIIDGGVTSVEDATVETHVVGVGDIDGDGRADLVRRSSAGDAVTMIFMNGLDPLGQLEFEAFSTEASVAAIADFDGDGAGEILWLDDTQQRLTLWDLKAGEVDAIPLGELGSGWKVVGAGDFDAAGGAEIFVHHAGAATLEVWRVTENQVVESIALPNAAGFDPISVGDFNGDGLTDLALQERGTNEVVGWLSDGASVTSTVLLEGTGEPSGNPVDRLCAADFDGDGWLGREDFLALKTCMGSAAEGSCAFADLNGDGKVSPRDFRIFKRNYGTQVCRL